MIVKAPKAPSCCSACGKLGAIFRRPLTLDAGVAAALLAGLGTESQIRERITDMLSSRLLLDQGEAHGH